MDRLDPKTFDHQPLRLSSAFPFISGNGIAAFQNARITLKLSCLLHESVTLPTALVVANPFLRTLVLENADFLSSGSLMLGLRASSNSLREHIISKFGESAASEALAVADILDSICSAVIVYDESAAAGRVKGYVLSALRAFRDRARKATIQESIDRAIGEIDAFNGVPSLEYTEQVLNGCYLGPRMRKIAHFVYCAVGADITNGVPLIPTDLWEATHIASPKIVHIQPGVELRGIADAAVMDYFAVRREAIDRLTAAEILELRSEPLTHRYISELDAAVTEVKDQFANAGTIASPLIRSSSQLASEIQKCIVAKCMDERRRDTRDSRFLHVVEEVGGAVIPLIATAKKGMAKLARTTARRTGAGWFDFTTTPINTHVTRFHSALAK